MSAPAFTLDQYQLRLPAFEGPLDVLLRLIERERMAITDVSLVAVTDGFLAYLADLGNAPAPLLAEFAAVAGRLLVLKSRSLLPRPAPEVEEEAPSDLARQLAEHRAIRDAAASLAGLDRLGLAAFPRGEAILQPRPVASRLAIHPPASLARALRRRLLTLVPVPEIPTPRQTISIGQMLSRFVERLRSGRRFGFGDVLSDQSDRLETLVAFLSLLILVRRRVADATQDDLFGEIAVTLAEGVSVDALDARVVADSGDPV